VTVRNREALREAAKASSAEIDASSKLARYRNSGRATKPGLIPAGPSGTPEAIPFRWRLLNGTERQLVRSLAVARIHSIGIPLELLGASDLEDEASWQILAVAMRDPDEAGADPRNPYPRPLAANVDELRDLLDANERDILVTHYLDFEEECDPEPTDLGEQELGAIVALAKKKPAESLGPLINFGSRTLARCLLTLVGQQSTSPSGSSSNSTPS
jgi:hypothetical protein